MSSGVVSNVGIEALIKHGSIYSATTIIDPQAIQPSSLDLHCGNIAYRMSACFLPGSNCSVDDMRKQLTFGSPISLEHGAILEKGCTYLVPLQERLRLPENIEGVANPKSSTGRLDIFTRLVSDYANRFDTVRPGYCGRLYILVYPQSFTIMLTTGSKLVQLRFRDSQNSSYIPDVYLQRLPPLKRGTSDGVVVNGGLILHFGAKPKEVCAYKARMFAPYINVNAVDAYDREEFWEEVRLDKNRNFIVHPNELYILASQENLHIPAIYAAEMGDIDTHMGEYRAHYAGFFDPGFQGNAVFELRGMSTPFIVSPGQPIGRLRFEKMRDIPTVLYGKELQSNYQGQGLRLSKHFKQ